MQTSNTTTIMMASTTVASSESVGNNDDTTMITTTTTAATNNDHSSVTDRLLLQSPPPPQQQRQRIRRQRHITNASSSHVSLVTLKTNYYSSNSSQRQCDDMVVVTTPMLIADDITVPKTTTTTTTTTTVRQSRGDRRVHLPQQLLWCMGLCVLWNVMMTTIGVSAFHLRINSGPLFTDSQKNRWEDDVSYNFGNKGARDNICTRQPSVIIQNITNGIPRQLYCTQRYYNQKTYPAPYQYRIAVPSVGYYVVKFHFIEFQHNIFNKRVMNITIENKAVISNFDVVAVTGGRLRAHIITTLPQLVTDGVLTINFRSIIGPPIISGVEIIQSANLVTHRINCGALSNTLTVVNGTTWSKDQFALSGGTSNRCTKLNVTNSIDCSTRYFRTSIGTPLRYNIPVPYNNSLYTLKLHFLEHVYSAAGKRLFDVWVENALILDNFDIFALAPGKNIPLVVSLPAPIQVTDGTMTIDFVEIAGTGDPQINGIEVTYVGPPIVSSPTAPVKAPISAPIKAPVSAPIKAPVSAPVKAPVSAPIKAPVSAPIKAPISAPVKAPISAPVKAPVSAPVKAPTMSPVPAPVPISGNIVHRINCGTTNQVVVPPENITWTPDQFATNGLSFNTCGNITTSIYCTSRYFRAVDVGAYRYELPVQSNRNYHVRLHFMEQHHLRINARIFDVFVEGVLVADNLDIFAVAPGRNVSYIITASRFVADGNLTIELTRNKNNPQINAIEVFDDGVPIPTPTLAPQTLPPALPPNSAPTTTFQDILINCGGPPYLEHSGLRTWYEDMYFNGGSTYSITNIAVANTADDPIYQSERVGTFSYSIPVPLGTYEIIIHLAELAFTSRNIRTFNLTIESEAFDLVDIFSLAGGTARAVTLGTTLLVDDGFATISVAAVKSLPKINAIEIKSSLPHIAHSVSNGPYFAVDTSNIGSARVFVDGSESHTHGTDLFLTSWTWKKGSVTLGTGEITNFTLPVGIHDISLTVVDNGNFRATEETTVTVHSFGFPDITTLTPSSGSMLGGELVTIRGSGFTFSAAETIVFFGIDQLTGSAIQVVNATTITVSSPQIPLSVPVQVSVQTPRGRSQESTYVYVSSIPISFSTTRLMDFTQPTSVDFGPDGKLYVGSLKGTLEKISFNNDFTAVVGVVSAVVQPDRAILGITFDPMDASNPNPPVYISSSLLFHGESKSSSGTSINGKISRISGANLDIIEDVVTGLPVCDLDHALNQIQFGNKGEMYINIGSNTNGGVPGSLSGSGKLLENYFSASTVVANLADPAFDGFIEYDALDDGSPVNFNGVSVFAPGLRNPFGLTLHSNGNLYATDNGPNTGYGKMKVGCGPSDLLADQQREDKLVHLIKDKYYGHPNPKRATYHNDPRQCVWRNPTEPTSANYQSPIGVVLSSATGIIEYKADHFNGQLRGNLIHVKYKKELLRTVLSADGLSANPLTIPGLKLLGRDGLDVAQAPNGNIIEARYTTSSIFVSRPIEAATAAIRVSAVHPTRGGLAGGTLLRVYGLNFGTSATVTVGGAACPIVAPVTNTFLQCTLPGRTEGLHDIVVTAIAGTYTFQNGYRYITGR